ncbi:RDD family protein [Microbacterium terrisoli]|uniref:RDD family protein n=1 Tax=Microbacterium terrisoli TaxID=3242192 RepID=UPI0028061F54|nr:RDD family protein [Microbacterium protaetiae]
MTDHVSTAVAAPVTIGARVLAYLLDAAVAVGVMALVGGFAAIAAFAAVQPADAAQAAGAFAIVQLVMFVVAVVWGLVYTAMQGGAGSIGQRALGLVLTDPNDSGARVGFGRALVRNLIWMLGCAIVVGYASALFDASPYHQGWHDKVARTVVGDRRGARHVVSQVPRMSTPRAPASAGPVLWGAAGAAAPRADAAAAPVITGIAAGSSSGPGSSGPGSSGSGAAAASAPTSASTAAAAPVIMAVGMISEVPGVAHSQQAAPDRTPIPTVDAAAPVPAPGSITETMTMASVPAASAPADGDVGETRISVNPVDAPAAPVTAAVVQPSATVMLVWDNGTRIAVYGRTVFGRNPAREDGATVVAVRDETLSLSKTHFEVGGDASAPWIIDRHSTNGVVLVRNGRRATLSPGARTPVRAGDRLEFGDRALTVEACA